MYAVIRTGGKQYRVAKNDVIRVERLPAEAGATVALEEVLLLEDGAGGAEVGRPLVAGACVAATVLEQARAEKIIVFKKKRRKNYRRKHGHRQALTVLRITDILTEGRRPESAAAAAPEPEAAAVEPEAAAAPKAAARKAAPKKAAAKKPAAARAPARRPRKAESEE